MEKDRDEDYAQTINFALLIHQIEYFGATSHKIVSENQGISESDIIMLVECWLEKFKDRFKSNVKDNIFFGHKNPSKASYHAL